MIDSIEPKYKAMLTTPSGPRHQLRGSPKEQQQGSFVHAVTIVSKERPMRKGDKP